MTNLSAAQHTLDDPNYQTDYYYGLDERLEAYTRAQVHATLAVAEAQETANLIAFLEWAEGKGDLVSTGEYIKAVKQVKERIK